MTTRATELGVNGGVPEAISLASRGWIQFTTGWRLTVASLEMTGGVKRS